MKKQSHKRLCLKFGLERSKMVVKVHGPAYGCPKRVIVCLIEKQIEFETLPLDLFKDHHKDPHFLKLQVQKLCPNFFFFFIYKNHFYEHRLIQMVGHLLFLRKDLSLSFFNKKKLKLKELYTLFFLFSMSRF